MTATLQDAIAAVRAGEPERAQLLAADVVRHNPDDPNGWYLLSQLVESDARRAAYLSKTLALDPNYTRARAEFAALPPAVVEDLAPQPAGIDPVAVAEPPLSITAEDLAELDTTGEAAVAVAAQDTVVATEEIASAPEGAGMESAEAAAGAATLAEVPEWLQPLTPEPVPAAVLAAEAQPSPAATQSPAQPRPSSAVSRPRPVAPPANARKQSNQALGILLGLLGLLTLLVLVFLIYLLFF